MGFDFGFMLATVKVGLGAAPLTARLALASFVISLFFGTAIAALRVYNIRFFAPAFKIFVNIIKAVPGILVLYIFYFLIVDGFNFLAQSFHLGVNSSIISVNTIGIVVLSFTGSITVSETIRGSFMSVQRGQYEGAYSVGLTGWQTLRRIILPQVVPVAVPVLCNNLIVFVKTSSILYFIAVMDILNTCMIPATANYKFLEAYIAAALIYWGICFIIEKVSRLLERKLSRFRRVAV
jgi:L-cystine transport system permease protein